MINNHKCLAIIPARGGSKGIPKKNIIDLCGKPLLAYTAEEAVKSKFLDKIIISTDSIEIANIATNLGLEVPFIRPPYLSGDRVSNPPVVYHVINFCIENGFTPSIIVLLQPTAPLRKFYHIDEAVQLLVDKNSDSVVSVVMVPEHFSPHWQFIECNGELKKFMGGSLKEKVFQRQLLPKSYVGNGAIYAFWMTTLLSSNSYYGDKCIPYIMEEEYSINIDNKEDLLLAKRYIEKEEDK